MIGKQCTGHCKSLYCLRFWHALRLMGRLHLETGKRASEAYTMPVNVSQPINRESESQAFTRVEKYFVAFGSLARSDHGGLSW